MVIFAFADRLKVVASLKVMPSEELEDVCTWSLRKMSSRKCSGSEFLLRMTVAMPVSVATLPIGSLEAGAEESVAAVAGAGGFVAGPGGFAAGGVGAAGVGVGWAWVRRMTSKVATTPAGSARASVGVGIAKSLAGAVSISAPISARASESLWDVTTDLPNPKSRRLRSRASTAWTAGEHRIYLKKQ
jgi:hypothetical protein